MSEETIYLDHNATTPLLPEVVDALLPSLREHFGNPSSSHAIGRGAGAAVDTAREGGGHAPRVQGRPLRGGRFASTAPLPVPHARSHEPGQPPSRR